MLVYGIYVIFVLLLLFECGIVCCSEVYVVLVDQDQVVVVGGVDVGQGQLVGMVEYVEVVFVVGVFEDIVVVVDYDDMFVCQQCVVGEIEFQVVGCCFQWYFFLVVVEIGGVEQVVVQVVDQYVVCIGGIDGVEQ